MIFSIGEKQGHEVIIDINEEPVLDISEKQFQYKLNDILIDGKPVTDEKKYYYHEFTYKYNGNNKVFCLYFKYKIVKTILKKMGVKTNFKELAMALPKEVEHYFINTLNPKGETALAVELKKIEDKILEEDKKILDDTVISMSHHSSNGYKLSTDVSPKSKLLSDIKIKLNTYHKIFSKDIFKDFQTDYDLGDYSITTYYELKYSELKKILKDIDLQISDYEAEKEKKKKEKQDKIDKLKKIAFETNTKQEYSRWSEPCNDPREECDVDIVVEYIMPDGTFKLERFHTW